VLAVCAAQGVDVLPVKGVLTGHLFYRDPGERPIKDVDLRVVPKDLQAVERAGLKAGWRPVARSRVYGTLGFDVLGFLVEFETSVGPPGLSGLAVHDMIDRATRAVKPFGVPHRQPEIHDHGLLLCVNAFKDKMIDAPAGAIRDLERLPAQPGFSSRRFTALAFATGTATITWVVADWLASVRGCEPWARLRDSLGPPRRTIYTRILGASIRSTKPPRALLRVLARAGADAALTRVRALGAMTLEPMVAAIDRLSSHGQRARGNQKPRGRRPP
jgi:hypothetical protein